MSGGLIAVLLSAFFFVLIAELVFRRRKLWGAAWTFFLVIVLTLWSTTLYMRVVGPAYWGVASIPLIFGGLLLARFVLACFPGHEQTNEGNTRVTDFFKPEQSGARSDSVPTVGKIFYLLIFLLAMVSMMAMVNPY